jgi:hypothetical protein
VYAAAAKAGALGPDGSMHLPSAAANCPQVAGLTDHPAAFGYVWSVLGWLVTGARAVAGAGGAGARQAFGLAP